MERFLERYDSEKYKKPAVTVDTLIFTEKKLDEERSQLQILLVKRKDHPCIDKWAIPGGFVNMDEDIDAAALRELKEETNVDDVYLEQLYTFGDVGRDPRDRIISVSYVALVDYDKLKPKAGDDAAEVAWFRVEKNILSSSQEESNYRLIFYNEEIKIEYLVLEKSVKKGSGRSMGAYIKPSMENTDLLAFDHEKMINLAINKLNNLR
ncbi:NUDIX hydrolase [Clostridium sp. UBA7503]|uniref:NUDIX hydrolase n=1 Tax=Clostridium sp. UBA7503 TaxID=1946377 RepID=UPI0032180E8F